MDTLLIAVTGLSLAMALGMGLLVFRMVREERRRADARVATLIAIAGDGPGAAPRRPVREFAAPVTLRIARDTDASRRPVVKETGAAGTAAASAAAADGALHVTHGELFSGPARSSPWRTRLAVSAGLAAVLWGAGYLLLSPGSRSVPDSRTVKTEAAVAAPLELLSLGHAQQHATLSVSGVVQNPRTGAPLTRVVATAIAFSADGAFLASGRAPLDFTSLAPGTESPFVVQIPVTGTVARYRVGFRAEDGGVIAHVDKRGPPDAVARK
jgi:hypothetical protein